MSVANSTITPMLVGLLVSMALWGMSCLQAYQYFRDFPKDSWRLKAVVTACWVGDTTHQILISYTLYTLVDVDFSNAHALEFVPKTLALSFLFLEVPSLVAQSYFTQRIWKLTGQSRALTGFAITLIVAKLGCTINYTVQAMRMQTFLEFSTKMDSMTTGHVAIDVASDVFISAVIVWQLRRNKTEYKTTRHIIDKLLVLATTTGALTGFMTIAMLIVHLVVPRSLVFFGLYFILGRLYANSLLAALNIRKRLRRNVVDVELSEPRMWPPTPSCVERTRSEGVTIQVDTVQEKTIDLPGMYINYDASTESSTVAS